MSNMHLVTGYLGQEHITAVDQAAFNAALIGTGQFVLDKGKVFEAQVISNNQVRVYDGELMMQGRFVRLEPDTYVDLTIENGAQGMKRNDLVVVRYTKDTVTGVEGADLVVIKGTADASNPADPEYTESDITNGAAVLHDFPLWRIPLDGLNVGEPVSLFGEPFIDSMRTLPEIRRQVNQIHSEVDAQLAEQDAAIDAKIAELDEYTKNEVLTDATRTLFGMDSSAVPDDVFAFLGKYNKHWWKRRLYITEAIPAGYELLAKETVSATPDTSGLTTVTATVKVTYGTAVTVSDDGSTISIVNPQTETVTATGSAQSPGVVTWNCVGRFFTTTATNEYNSKGELTAEHIYYGSDTSTFTLEAKPASKSGLTITDVQQLDGYSGSTGATIGEWEYLHSVDRNAYPDSGITGVYEYGYLGIPFDNAVAAPAFATGSYTGTGTYGESNPNSLAFDFVPRLVVITNTNAMANAGVQLGGFAWHNGQPKGMTTDGTTTSSPATAVLTWSGNTLSWYNASNAQKQLNYEGDVYHYVAFG